MEKALLESRSLKSANSIWTLHMVCTLSQRVFSAFVVLLLISCSILFL